MSEAIHHPSQTEYGPDYCQTCSDACGDWVQWPCEIGAAEAEVARLRKALDVAEAALDVAEAESVRLLNLTLEEARQSNSLPDWLSDVERLAKNIYYTTGVDGLRWDLLDDEDRDRFREMARKIVKYLPASDAPVVCPYCGGLEGRHGLVHIRNGAGGGHNEQCPRAAYDDAASEESSHICLRDDS